MQARHPLVESPVRHATNKKGPAMRNKSLRGRKQRGLGKWARAGIEALEPRQFFSTTVYVDALSPGSDNGSSWANAYTTLQQALAVATAGQIIEVGQGSYAPPTTGNDSFNLITGVEVLGGFAGYGTANPDARSPGTFITSLIGNGSDQPILTDTGTDSTAVLDGFTISGAVGASQGGGLLVSDGTPTINNCVFMDDSAIGGGGAVADINDAAPTFTSCVFLKDSGDGGGAMYNYVASPTLIDCTFNGNESFSNGGAIGNYDFASPTLINCAFSGNVASDNGGAIADQSDCSANLINCTLSGNLATIGAGGAIVNFSSSPQLSNCIVWGNSGDSGSELFNDVSVLPFSDPTITYSDIEGGFAGTGNIDADPLFIRNPSPGPDQVWGTSDDDYGDLAVNPYSPVVDAGDNFVVPANITTDLAGNNRFQDVPTSAHTGSGSVPIVDMGAFEATPTLAATAGGPYYVLAGQNITLAALGSSSVSGVLQYAWDFTGNGLFNSASGSNPVFPSATLAAGTTVSISLRLTDASSKSVVVNTTVTVVPLVSLVDSRATGLGNGTSWANAFPTLTAALSSAVAGQTIDVATGTYMPTNTQSRTQTFQLIDGVSIEGGFAGLGAANPYAQNVSLYPTILSGNLNGAESYHVVRGGFTNSSAVLDGLTITGGDASSEGGGLYNESGSPTIENCTFTNNHSANGGAAVYNYASSSPSFTGCTFTGNSAESGGGGAMSNYQSSPTLIDCTFTENTAPDGGAIDNYFSSSTITNCAFIDNSASYAFFPISTDGGAVENSFSDPTLVDCLFNDNTATQGAGIDDESESAPTLINCTFSNNTASTGGAVNIGSGTSLTLSNCILWGDTAATGAELSGATTSISVTTSDIQGGLGTIDADPQWVSPTTGNFQLKETSPCINDGTNSAVPSNLTVDLAGNPRIIDGVVDLGAYEAQLVAVTWTGLGDGINWSNRGNWSDLLVPTQNDDVTIPPAFAPQIGTGSFAVHSLLIQGTSRVDLGSGSLAIDYGGGNPSPLASVKSEIASGFNGGLWNGPGIDSGAAATHSGFAVGYADGNLDSSTAAAPNQLLLKYALIGDANLDGTVNLTDLLVLLNNYGQSGKDWSDGDFNYDGTVNLTDLLGLLNNYGISGGSATSLAKETPVFANEHDVPVALSNDPANENTDQRILGDDSDSILSADQNLT